jgi:hypothetical protein
VQAASRQRELVTGRRLAPNSFVEANEMSFQTDKEPDNVNETPSQNRALVAAGGNGCNGPRGLDNHGQELLAK